MYFTLRFNDSFKSFTEYLISLLTRLKSACNFDLWNIWTYNTMLRDKTHNSEISIHPFKWLLLLLNVLFLIKLNTIISIKEPYAIMENKWRRLRTWTNSFIRGSGNCFRNNRMFQLNNYFLPNMERKPVCVLFHRLERLSLITQKRRDKLKVIFLNTGHRQTI